MQLTKDEAGEDFFAEHDEAELDDAGAPSLQDELLFPVVAAKPPERGQRQPHRAVEKKR